MANHSEVSVSISCSNFIGIAMINEVIVEDEREIRALSDRFDNKGKARQCGYDFGRID